MIVEIKDPVELLVPVVIEGPLGMLAIRVLEGPQEIVVILGREEILVVSSIKGTSTLILKRRRYLYLRGKTCAFSMTLLYAAVMKSNIANDPSEILSVTIGREVTRAPTHLFFWTKPLLLSTGQSIICVFVRAIKKEIVIQNDMSYSSWIRQIVLGKRTIRR